MNNLGRVYARLFLGPQKLGARFDYCEGFGVFVFPKLPLTWSCLSLLDDVS